MAPKATPGREKLLAKLQRVRQDLQHRRADIDRYLTWAAKQVAQLPPVPAVNASTLIMRDLCWLEKVHDFIDYRVVLLRSKGALLDDSWEFDIEGLVARFIKAPRGTETMAVVLKEAVSKVEDYLRFVLEELDEVDRQLWDWLNTVVNVANDCVRREADAAWFDDMTGCQSLNEWRQGMAVELNPDAVWLAHRRRVLQALEKAYAEDDDWKEALALHERDVWGLLEEASEMRIEVGQRQTLLTQYFRLTRIERNRSVQREENGEIEVRIIWRQTRMTEHFVWG